MSFSQFEMLKDFSLPALSHFGSRFKLFSFFSTTWHRHPPLLVAANWQATRWFPLTKSHSNVCRRKAYLEGMVAVVQSSRRGRGFMTFFGSWVEYSVHLRCSCLNWHMWVYWGSHGGANKILSREHLHHWFESDSSVGMSLRIATGSKLF